MNKHTSKTLRVENNTYTVIETAYDDEDRPIVGKTSTFNSEQEAEEYMTKKTNPQDLSPIDNNTIDAEGLHELNAQEANPNTQEKPASEMTEADAVALNSDVHLAVPGDSPRIVTDGQKDQVAAGIHPDATEGKPLQPADEVNQPTPAPAEDLHVRETSNN